jgi:DNA-binding beta-propeller fold protein YncE
VAVAYNPSTKKMATTPVAQYEYDAQGRLRAEWDPRISPALKRLYGYDTEGHVTAVSGPGSQPWLFHYGTIPEDVSTGSLLSAIRPSASTAIGSGEVPVNTARPALSSTKPKVGVKISVSSNGTWSGSPLSYSYQWDDCNTSKACHAIPGAVNESYYPVKEDDGWSLIAVVSAQNATATVTAATEYPTPVAEGTPYSPALEPPSVGSNSVWSIEYQVPLSGSELQTMTKAELEKWGQTDAPIVAAAIFPPDEPMGWPAKDYKRATVYYMDSEARTVNVASPSGGLTTTEYNENNDAVRMLSADNRTAALKEGSKSAEVSKKLDTESKYNGEIEKGSAEPGTRLMETIGPEHKVKLSSGTEVSARSRTRYSYDEGAPQGETFDLATKAQVGAEYEGKEADIRETRTSYSGQKGLGWKLRMPTSVTTDPTGLDLTKTTVYEEHENTKKEIESTGNVVETKSPAGSSEAVYPPAFSASVGSEGTGAGQFKRPLDVALDASGNEWVVDKENDRIEKFSSSGAFIEALGWGVSNGEAKYEVCTSSCRAGIAGSGGGQFYNPWGIAINQSTGNVYVSDSEGNRIEELSSAGGFVEAIGWGVSDGKSELETCKSSCKAGIAGSGNGQLSFPAGITVDASGHLWVADKKNNRIQEFSSTGSYMAQFGSKGSGEGQLNEPVDVTISEGELYVLDYGNSRVEEFSPAGTFLSQFGVSGTGPGQFKEPKGIAANPNSGNIYVSDTGNERVEEFSPAGKFLVEFGVDGTGKGQMNSPTGLTISPTGELYIANEYNNRIDEWLPPEANNTRLVYSTQFGTLGSGHEQFNDPTAAAMDGNGNVWVSDLSNSRIEELSASGKYIAAYGTHGSGEVQFSGSRGIAINQSTGNVYVCDGWNNRIEELSSSGTFVRAWGKEGTGNGQFKTPTGIAIDSSGNVWVTDYGNSRIQEFSAEGTFIATYGSFGTGNREFRWPEGITFAAGHIYVTDTGNDRVQELTTAGAYVAQFGGEGNAGGQFKGPSGITSDSAGNLYIVDADNDRVEKFNSSGTFLATVGSLGGWCFLVEAAWFRPTLKLCLRV